MKPSIGRKVYCIYQEEIYEEEVGYTGKDSFIIDDFSDNRCFDSLEYFYEEYNSVWFTSLARAKKTLLQQLRSMYGVSFRIVEIESGYWSTRGIGDKDDT